MSNKNNSSSKIKASLLTPLSPSGIAVISLWGEGSSEVLLKLFHPVKRKKRRTAPYPSEVLYGFLEYDNQLLDEVLIFQSDKGCDAYEICCHGGVTSSNVILNTLSSCGVTIVPWSHQIETKTLKHDLLNDLLQSEGKNQAAQTAHQLCGSLSEAFRTLENALRAISSPKNSISDDSFGSAIRVADQLEASYESGKFLHRNPKVVIQGPANAGKSTLFNSILGERRALTSKIPGTTRDPVESSFLLDGFPLRLYDLPGEELNDVSELTRNALQNAHTIISDADLCLNLINLEMKAAKEFSSSTKITNQCIINVYNKSDLISADEIPQISTDLKRNDIVISALKERGIDALMAKISEALYLKALCENTKPIIVNKRQLAMVRKIKVLLRRGDCSTQFLDSLSKYLR